MKSPSELDGPGFARLLAFLGEGTHPLTGYEAARTRLIDFFRWRGIRDPETYADRTFDRVAAKLSAGETPAADTPFRYVLGVARFIYLEGTRAEVKAKTALTVLPDHVAPDAASDDLLNHLGACLAQLDATQRQRLLAYHDGRGQARIHARQALADELGISVSSLRVRMFRLRQQVEICVRARQSAETKHEEPSPSTR
ncbi:MAG: hypothetical protein AAFV29_13660 [Myxococcota bacterium]